MAKSLKSYTIKKDKKAVFKSIILRNKRTNVEFTASDDWLINMRYMVNGRETYFAQVILPDVAGRVQRLIKEGYNEVPKSKSFKKVS